MPSTGPEHRPVIQVAAGCLVNAAGEVLIAQRPAGKIAAGQWEFPGGKIEAGESARAALTRELQEELGVTITQARPLIRVRHDYRDRTVVLDTWKISAWQSEPHGREQQAFAWVRPQDIHRYPILAADAPILRALQLPDHYAFTAPDQDEAGIRAGLAQLPAGALLRLRRPDLGEDAYADLARRLLPAVHAQGLRLMLDRDAALVAQLGADGWHARAAALRSLSQRPDVPLCIASCHDAEELRRARELDCDAAVLGSVLPTASHPGAPGLGWAAAAALVNEANLPVFLIGGLQRSDLERVQAMYAQGVAGIGTYWRR